MRSSYGQNIITRLKPCRFTTGIGKPTPPAAKDTKALRAKRKARRQARKRKR
jgi:hypothetical protein